MSDHGPRTFAIAIGAVAAVCVAVRAVGQFLAGHAERAWERYLMRQRRSSR